MRKFLAILFAKIATALRRLQKGSGTVLGGRIALKICPDILGRLKMPDIVVGITGTNGKTTVTNMIANVAKINNMSYASNLKGANVKAGIVTALLDSSDMFGNIKKDMVILEIDERYTPKTFEDGMKLDYLIITNITRDSMKRNANTDYISKILHNTIPKGTKIIVNGDDVIASQITDNEKVYYGILRQEEDRDKPYNIIRDIVTCPKCGSKIEYDFVRRNHIGRLHCTKCDFKNPELDYKVVEIDRENEKMKVVMRDKEDNFHIVQDNIYNIYNELAVIALFNEIGISKDKIKHAMESLDITKERYSKYELRDGKQLITNLCKGQNPVASTNVIVSMMEDNEKKCVILELSKDVAPDDSEPVMWYFETDFEMLKRDDVLQIIIVGPREKELYVRLLIAGIPEDRIIVLTKKEDVAKNILIDDVSMIYILHDLNIQDELDYMKEDILRLYGK